MLSKFLKHQIVPDDQTTINSHSINKFVAKALQKSDSEGCEYSEQLCPIKPINSIKSGNQHKYSKLSAKKQIPKYQYNQQKNILLCPKLTQN